MTGLPIKSDTGFSSFGALTQTVASAVDAVGKTYFADRFHDVVNRLAPIDMCAAFIVNEEGDVEHLFATGRRRRKRIFLVHGHAPEGRSEMRRVVFSRRIRDKLPVNLPVVATSCPLSRISAYRRWWYSPPRIVERISVQREIEAGRLIACAYRIHPADPFSASDFDRFVEMAPILMGLTAKHAELIQKKEPEVRLHADPDDIALSLVTTFRLSAREAEICALILLLHSQKEISELTGLSQNTVTTYRRRAYQKLGIATRRQLVELFDGPSSALSHKTLFDSQTADRVQAHDILP